MATMQQQILEQFYKQLSESDLFAEKHVNDVRDLLSSEKKPKAEKVMAIFSTPSKKKAS